MKKLLLFSFAAITILLLPNCKKAKDLLRFDMNYSTEMTVPPAVSNVVLDLLGVPVTTNSNEIFSTQGTKKDLVKEIRLKSSKLTITSPSGRTFGFVKSIEVWIAKEDGSNKKLIAYKNDIPENAGSSIDLDVDNSLLLDDYIKADKFQVSSKTVMRQSTSTSTDLRADMVFNVLANPL